jgi:hypothetical protein
MLEPPGSYCAYACMYITSCLIKIFTLATNTFEEQHRHILKLQQFSASLAYRSQMNMSTVNVTTNLNGDQFVQQQSLSHSQHGVGGGHHHSSSGGGMGIGMGLTQISSDSYDNYDDNNAFFIDGQDLESNPAINNSLSPRSPPKYGSKGFGGATSTGLMAGSATNVQSPRLKSKIKKLDNTSEFLPAAPSATTVPNTGVVGNSNVMDFSNIVKDNLNTFQLLNTHLKSGGNTNEFNNPHFFAPVLGRSRSNDEENKLHSMEKQQHNVISENAAYNPENNQEVNQPLLSNNNNEAGQGPLSIQNPLELPRNLTSNAISISNINNNNNNNLSAGNQQRRGTFSSGNIHFLSSSLSFFCFNNQLSV